MPRIFRLLGSFVVSLVPLFAAVGNISVQTTSSQAVIAFTVTNPAQCTVQIFSFAPTGVLLNDTNEVLFPGSAQCNRPGSAVNGTAVSFVAGTRAAAKASDGKMHSRAFAALTTYSYLITDLVDSTTAAGTFTTNNLPAGNLYPEQPPFDPNGWDNRGHPQFDWTLNKRDQMLVDPTYGLLVKRMTFAGDGYTRSFNSTDGQTPQLASPVIGGGACSNTAALNASGAAFATCTGATSIYMPLPVLPNNGGGTFNNWFPANSVEDILLYVYGAADNAAIRIGNTSDLINICLTQGVNLPCLSRQIPVQLSGNVGIAKVPAKTLTPVFANWGYTPLHGDVAPSTGTVSVSGNTVTVTNAGQWNTYANAFNIDWPTGSQIYIAGSAAWGCVNSYCTIASIQSATQLTTFETCMSGCPTSATYEGRAFGFRVARQGASGSVTLSFGFEFAQSSTWSVGEDGITEHCNANPVTVSNDAHGNPYPGYTLSGYLCLFQNNGGSESFWLIIPHDQNGAPLGESRPLGPPGIPYTVAWASNGATFPTGTGMTFAGWDETNPAKFYVSITMGQTQLLGSGIYDPTKKGCSPAYQNWVGAQNYTPVTTFPPDTCFTYTNSTNPSSNPPMDLRSQIVQAYPSYNPGVDVSGFGTGTPLISGGYANECLVAAGGGDRSLRVCGTFNASTGQLVQMYDSFSKYPGRWGYAHGPTHVVGRFHALSLDQPYPASASPNNVLYGPFEMAVTGVNRAGYGQAASWSSPGVGSGTSIAANEAYACPTNIPQYLIAQGASGNHCVQVQVSSEPCSHTPGTATIYPGGQNEAQRYPCTSTDGSAVINPAWSKLQNLAVGDWVRQNDTYNDYGEEFIVITKQVISPTQIQMWLIRGGGVWPNAANVPYNTLSAVHPDGFSLAMTANWIIGAANWLMDGADTTSTWLPDNPAWVLTHATQAVGSNPNNKIAIALDLQNPNNYAGFFDTPVLQQVMQPIPDVTVGFPIWAGSTAGFNSSTQAYMNNDQVSAAPSNRTWAVNYRHLNPSGGSGPEYRTGAGPPNNPTLVAGTSQVYKLTNPYSGGPADPKRLPFLLFAGRFQLLDVSSPVTSQNTITDQTNWAACYALNAGECRTTSSAGDYYASVPFAAGENTCLVNQYEEVAPCIANSTPIAGKIQQMDVSGSFDSTGARQRMLSTGLTGIGGIYQFSGPKMLPDASWMLVPCWWLNGVRSEVCGVYLPPLPPSDGIVRSDFVPYDVNVPGQPGDQTRICWGYAENGPVDGSPNSLFPASRQERGCSTGGAPASLISNRAVRRQNAAQFASTDTATQGSWQSRYGSEGYSVAADLTQFNSATVKLTGAAVYTWAASTTDVRALQKASGTARIAATYYSPSTFLTDITFTDNNQHQAAFYFLDWENAGRTETVQVLDGDTGAVLDTENLKNFSQGVYLVWNLSGHVKLQFTNTSQSNAVLGGIFFGGPGASVPNGPFTWASETPVYTPCDSGCRVRMQLVPNRVAYYYVERKNNGQITTSPIMVAVQP